MRTIGTKDGPSDNEQSRDDGLPMLLSMILGYFLLCYFDWYNTRLFLNKVAIWDQLYSVFKKIDEIDMGHQTTSSQETMARFLGV